jgi:hypothetical protein
VSDLRCLAHERERDNKICIIQQPHVESLVQIAIAIDSNSNGPSKIFHYSCLLIVWC